MLVWLKAIWQNPARDWVILFLAIHSVVQLSGSVNAYSRWMTLVSMVEDKTVRTDHYYLHTVDWSKTPDGHYYSNKAPGPMLLGYPVFWVLDRSVTTGAATRAVRDAARIRARELVLQRLSIITQAIPFAILVLWWNRVLEKRGVSRAALHFTAVAMLFGNTAALFMNTYFGHAMSAVFVLAGFLALFYKRYAQVGLYLGFGMLCDYGASLLLLTAAVLMLVDVGDRIRRLFWFALGGIIPGILWVSYHWYCFGSVFSLANKYQNPLFVDTTQASANKLWGILRIVPDVDIIKELLFGTYRSIFHTQGWVLVAILVIVVMAYGKRWEPRFQVSDKLLRDSAIFSFVGLGLLLAMNGSFNGWHGGGTPGPRYLSIVMPTCAIASGLIFTRVPAFIRQVMIVFLVESIVLFLLVFGTKNVVSTEGVRLYEGYFRNLILVNGPNLERMFYLALAIGFVTYRAYVDSTSIDVARGKVVPPPCAG
jgi:hypothetical protein